MSAESVNHPAHYGGAKNPYEAIKVIEAWELGFCLGNVVKYLSRAGKKPGVSYVEDLKKAAWYIEAEILARDPEARTQAQEMAELRLDLARALENAEAWKAQCEKKRAALDASEDWREKWLDAATRITQLEKHLDAARAEARLLECRLTGERPF